MVEVREQHSLEEIEPVGVVILGDQDPSLMTREEFRQASQLLFHGASRDLNFSSSFNYRLAEYHAENDGSTTLGYGFYTTPDAAEANNYSLVRQARDGVQAILVPILPYQAKVLDLRTHPESSLA